ILVDRARQKSAIKRGSGTDHVNIHEINLADATEDDRVMLVNEGLERMETENPETAQIITMRFFGGLSNREIAESIGISERTVERRWTYAKAELFRMIREQT